MAQFAIRDHTNRIFTHPFLYLAADTSDVMAATDPRRIENFHWHNMGLTNVPDNPSEYPAEFLYKTVLSKDQLLEALPFFLIRVPEREAEEDRTAQPAFTIFPRYHQSRMVRKVADDVLLNFTTTGDIGKKYLIDHSAGSGKTLSICWLADKLHRHVRHSLLLTDARDESCFEWVRCCAMCESSSSCSATSLPQPHRQHSIGGRSRSVTRSCSLSAKQSKWTKLLPKSSRQSEQVTVIPVDVAGTDIAAPHCGQIT